MHILEGLKVIDMGSRLNGSFVAMVLADFGAEVIRVDRPGDGGASFTRMPEDRMAAYWCTDRNKRSIVLNLKDESGRAIFRKLAKKSDVLIDCARPGAMDKMEIGYQALSAENERLIYAALSGYGQTGPYKMLPGHDMNFCALSGAQSMVGAEDGQPYIPNNFVADMGGAAMHGLAGILLALLAREKTGRGQFVDIAYLDTVISLLSFDLCSYFGTGKVPQRGKTQTTGAAVWAQVFRCSDGQYFTIVAPEDKLWGNLCRAIGCEDLVEARTLQTDDELSSEQKKEIIDKLAAVFATKTRAEWFEILKEVDTCATPVNNIDEAVCDPHILARDMIVELDHPYFGKVKQPGIAIKLSDTPGEIRSLGVPVGTNANEILAELGYSAAEIDSLHKQGTLG